MVQSASQMRTTCHLAAISLCPLGRARTPRHKANSGTEDLTCTTCAECAALLRVGAERRVGAAVDVRRAWLAGIAVVLPAHDAVKPARCASWGPQPTLQPQAALRAGTRGLRSELLPP